MSDRVERVQGLYQAFANGDVPTLLGALDPQVEWGEAEHGTLWPGHVLVGPDAVGSGVFARIPELFGDSFRVQVDRLHECGDTVIMQGRYTAVVQSTGRPLDAQVVHVWDLVGDTVVRWAQYTDTWQFAEATGIRPVPTTPTRA